MRFPALNQSAQSRPSTGYVTCWLAGQLGNQLCQVATTLACAWDRGAQPIFPQLNGLEYRLSYNRDRFFFRLDSGPLPRRVANVYNERAWWEYMRIPDKPDLYLKGIFFCPRHFHHHRNQLIQTFAPSQAVTDYLRQKYTRLLATRHTVSLHVRTYNKEAHAGAFFLLGLEYYEKAMDLFGPDATFVVFSDRINWCRRHFETCGRNIVFADGNDHIEDFFLMSMLDHHIVANSAYSWWSAYLGSGGGRTVAPSRWYRLDPWRFLPGRTTDLLPPEWITIDALPKAEYPADMTDYDAESRSIDTQ